MKVAAVRRCRSISKRVGVRLLTSAVNVTLPAFAAERRAAAPLLLGARRCRSISHSPSWLKWFIHPQAHGLDTDMHTPPTLSCGAWRSAAKPPHTAAAVEWWDRQTDGRTLDRFIDTAPHTMRVVSKRQNMKSGINPACSRQFGTNSTMLNKLYNTHYTNYGGLSAVDNLQRVKNSTP